MSKERQASWDESKDESSSSNFPRYTVYKTFVIVCMYNDSLFSISRKEDGVYQYRPNASHHDRIQQHVRFLDDSPDVSVVTGGATVGETSQNQVGGITELPCCNTGLLKIFLKS